MIVRRSKCKSALDRFTDIPAVNIASTTNAMMVEDNLIRYISTLWRGKYFISNTIANKPDTATSKAIIRKGTSKSKSNSFLTSSYLLPDSGNLPVRIKSMIDKLKPEEKLFFVFTFSELKTAFGIYCNRFFH